MRWKKLSAAIFLASILEACTCTPVVVPPAPLPLPPTRTYPVIDVERIVCTGDDCRLPREVLVDITRKVAEQAADIKTLRAVIETTHDAD